MELRNRKTVVALFLLIAALVGFIALVISKVSFHFFPPEFIFYASFDWGFYIAAPLLLFVSLISAYQIREGLRRTVSFFPGTAIFVGLGLGIVSAILLYTPAVGYILTYASLAPWLLITVFSSGFDLFETSLVLIALIFFVFFCVSVCVCSLVIVRRGGSVGQGFWSGFLTVMVAFLGTDLTFSVIDIVAHFIFHTGSSLIFAAPDASHSLADYVIGYQTIVQFLAVWFVTPAVLGLLVTFVASIFFARQKNLRAASV